jgi:hypothetical protein
MYTILANLTGIYYTSLMKLATGGFGWANNAPLDLQAVGWDSSHLTSGVGDCAAIAKGALVKIDCKNESEFICEDMPKA